MPEEIASWEVANFHLAYKEEFMRIAVFGTGAVGGYFGGRLAQAGEGVVFLARGAHLRAIQEHGLRIESVDGDMKPGSQSADRFPHCWMKRTMWPASSRAICHELTAKRFFSFFRKEASRICL
jgi:hypothetical protein